MDALNPAPDLASDVDFLRSARLVAEAAASNAAVSEASSGVSDADILGLHHAGLLRAPLSCHLGGRGLGTSAGTGVALCTILRVIGSGSLPLGRLYEGHVNATLLLSRYGTPSLQARVAAEVAEGHLLGVWNTDDRDGLHLIGDANGLQLTGRKILASGSGAIRRPLVTATTENDRHYMVMPVVDDPGRADLSSWTPMGMRASATGAVDFTGLTVAPDEILGDHDDYHRQPGFSGGAWRFAAVQLGAVEALIAGLRAHLRRTSRGGDPHQQVRLGEAVMAAETGRLWVERAAGMATDDGQDPDAVVACVNLTRLVVERAALDVLERVQRSIGLAAFMAPHPIERIARDLTTYLRQPAPDRALTSAAAWVLQSELPQDRLFS